MKTRIRFITRNTAGATEQHDKIVTAEAITIGRATDQVLHLKDRRVRLQHAEIRRADDGFHITTGALAGVTVNGRSERDARLAIGDVIEVGANILRVIEAGGGADLAISFELAEGARAEDIAADWTRKSSGIGGLSMRRLSWIAAVLVLAGGLLLPALGLVNPGIASFLRDTPLVPDDGLWAAGPLHSAHSAISEDCGSCHRAPFRRVPDAACTECHAVGRHAAATGHAVLGAVRCASCHLEHNEPEQLVNRHQALCADCHRDPPGDLPLEAASDFLDAHPRFRVSLRVPPAAAGDDDDWPIEHVTLEESRQAERSNLKFNHLVHLAAEGIVTPDGRRVIDCAECHQPEPGGARMRPIAMDEHCASCHTLSFDADDPARVVPHGDPEGVVQALVEYYSARLLGDDPASAAPVLRRPGQALSRTDRDRVATEARTRAMAVAADLFERRACVNCHEVTRSGDDTMPWRVEPVRLTESFFPHANFSHAAHDTDVTACGSCHAAAESESAADVLIPGIDTCRECHGSGMARRNRASQIPSTCIMCHSFHYMAKGEYQ